MNRSKLLFGVVFIAGFSSMVIELAAVRAMSPFFGSSVFVWTNLIGVILTALALGYFVGGKSADRWQTPQPLAWILVLAGFASTVAPFLLKLVASWFLPDKLRLEDAFEILWGGSLSVGALLFGIPAFLISFSSPVAIRFLAHEKSIGSVAGKVFCLSTLGSILGTFLTTYLLIPYLGSRMTFVLAGAILAITGLLLLFNSREGSSGRSAILGICLSLAGPMLMPYYLVTPLKNPEANQVLLREAETPYQYVQIVREGSQIRLKVNEGLDSYQSLWVEGESFTGAYYDYFLLAPFLAQKSQGEELSVLILGLAGGTISRQYEQFYGSFYQLRMDGIEIDRGLIRASKDPFKLNREAQPHLNIVSNVDGRVFLDLSPEQYDLILLDAYSGQIHIPFHLSSKEFFEQVKSHLKDGGVLAVNVGALGRRDPVLLAMANTISSVFGDILGVKVRDCRNEMLFARNNSPMPKFEKIYTLNQNPVMQPLLGYAAFPDIARHYQFNENEVVLTDDRSPMDWLQMLSLLEGVQD